MSIDEAIAQLEFNDKKGAKIMKEVRSRLASGASVINTCQTPDVCHDSQWVYLPVLRFSWKLRKWQLKTTTWSTNPTCM